MDYLLKIKNPINLYKKVFFNTISLVLFDIHSLRNISITPQIRIFDIGHKNILVVKVIQTWRPLE
jgi:hypothetical protein